MHVRSVAPALCGGLLALMALCISDGILAAAPYAGRPVQDVLRELTATGIRFVYNTQLVTSSMRVRAEPAASEPLEVARQILAPHGLGLLAAGEDVYAVVARHDGREQPASGQAGSPPLSEIVVTTSRYALATEEATTHTFLTQADAQALPKMADEALRSVQRLPGTAASGISAQSHMRGGEFQEVLMVVDGMPLDEPFHLKNFLTPVTVFDARAMESLDVHLGGFTAEHGGAMSGVIEVSTLVPVEDRYTELGLSLFHASALSAGRFADGRGQWTASLRRSNLDWLSDLVDSDVGRPEYFDLFTRVSYALTEDTSVFATVLTSGDSVEANTSDQTEHSDAEYRNTYLWGGWEQRWREHLTSRLILALTDIDNERKGTIEEPGQRSGELSDTRTLRSAVLRLDMTWDLPRLYTRFGFEGREQEARYQYDSMLTFLPDYPFPGDAGAVHRRSLAPSPRGHQNSAYVTSRARIGERLTAEAGLRWDDQGYDGLDDTTQLAPRVSLLYRLGADTHLRLAWGRYWQAQRINELQVEDGVSSFYAPQRADQLIVGLERYFPGDIELRLEAYQKDYERPRPRYENLFDPVRLMPELEFDRVLVAPQHSRVRGAELLLSRRGSGPWSWWLGYAWSRATDRIDGRSVVRSWDQRHTLNAGLRYAGEHWEFSLANSYHTGWPTTTLSLQPAAGGSGQAAVVGERNAERYGDYNSLDLRIQRRFDLPDSTLEAFFELTNALVQRNACCTEYEVSAPAGQPMIDADTDYWPKIIPSLGVLWKF